MGIDADGALQTGVAFTEQVAATNISVEDATIVGGMVMVRDDRSGEMYGITDLDGELRLTALRGPFAFQGAGTVGADGYAVRFTTTPVDEDGRRSCRSLPARTTTGSPSRRRVSSASGPIRCLPAT